MSALKFDSADLAISQARLAKILGPSPTKMTVRLSDAFGDFESVDCACCGTTGRLGSRRCPVCQDECDIAIEMRRTRETVREAIDVIRATQNHTDWGSEWQCQIARDALANALADLRALRRAKKAGYR